MASAQFGRFQVNSAGVAEVMTSGGMQALVGGHVGRLAAQANAASAAHHVNHRPIGSGHYEGVVKVGRADTLGVVRAADELGSLDQAIYHTMDSINH